MPDGHIKKVEVIAGGILFLIITGAALCAPFIAPANPLALDLSNILAPPSVRYPMGTDQLGRCVLSRVIYGAKISVSGAVVASLLSLLLGFIIGTGAASVHSRLARILTGLIDMAFALPGLIVALVCAGLLGASVQSLVAGLVLGSWPWWARLIRGLILSAREKEFVLAGQVAGISHGRLLTRYLLPQLKGPVLTALALKTGWIILAFSGLSYLGLGPAPPTPEWGSMLQESAIFMTQAPWLMIAPGMAATLTVLSLNLIGEGLNGNEPE